MTSLQIITLCALVVLGTLVILWAIYLILMDDGD